MKSPWEIAGLTRKLFVCFTSRKFLPFPVLGGKKKIFLAEIKSSQLGTSIVKNLQRPKAKTLSQGLSSGTLSVYLWTKRMPHPSEVSAIKSSGGKKEKSVSVLTLKLQSSKRFQLSALEEPEIKTPPFPWLLQQFCFQMHMRSTAYHQSTHISSSWPAGSWLIPQHFMKIHDR